MTLCLALFLLMPDDLPGSLNDPEPEPAPDPFHESVFIRGRGGIWASRAFRFEATTVGGSLQSSKQENFGSGGLDVGFSPGMEKFVVFGSVEAAFASHLRLEDAGLCVGFRDWADPGAMMGVPQEAMIYAGPIYGRFDITTPGFVEFNRAWGARAGVSFTWKLTHALGISLMAEYRYLKFRVKDKSEIASGNTTIGASGLWAGFGVDLVF